MSTEISWTDETWNPTTGCDRVSAGCDHCYALTLAARLKRMGQDKYQNDGDPRTSGPGFGLTMHPDALDLPLRWRKPRRVFVNSMSDLFHPEVPVDFIAKVWHAMMPKFFPDRHYPPRQPPRRGPMHTFQILTKRPQRMAQVLGAVRRCEHGWLTHDGENPGGFGDEEGFIFPDSDGWPLPNVWLGTSVENQRYADLRIPHLLKTPAAVRFLSVEPMLGPIDLTSWLDDLGRIGWVIVGGESGPGARLMREEWAEAIVEQCKAAGVAVFVKQLGTVRGGKAHHDIDSFPESLRVREWPALSSVASEGVE